MEDDEIEAVVNYLRAWESNPPVEFPPEVSDVVLSLSGAEIFSLVCSQCHGRDGEGLTGPSMKTISLTKKEIYDVIDLGHESTAMISWGDILTAQQIQDVTDFILSLSEQEPTGADETKIPSYEGDIVPIFDDYCTFCHGVSGGWDSSSYDATINSGDHGPAVVPGDSENSILAQTMLGTSDDVGVMPPNGKLDDGIIQVILDWIAGGAPEN